MLKKGNYFIREPETLIVFSMMSAAVLFQLLLRDYGFHGDELYYIAIGDGWSFSNMDTLPLTPLYLKLFTSIFGYSILTVHLASSVCCAGILGITCLITKELGGKAYAILLTGIFILFAGLVPAASVFSYDAPGHLIWIIALYGVVRPLKENNSRWAILTGIFIGIGMLNKQTILFLPFALVVSLLFVPQRTWFKNRWLWIAGGIIIIFSIPFVVWQFRHDWYFLDFATKYTGEMSYKASFPAFLWNQIIPNNVLSFPVWFMALMMLLFSSKWRIYRLFGICYILLLLLFYLLHMPFYFMMPLYAVLLAAGSVRIEQFFDGHEYRRSKSRISKVAIPVLYFIGSLPLLPLAVPILPVEQLISYTSKLGVNAGIRTNSVTMGMLPNWIADRFGWDDMMKTISSVYNSVPANDRSGTGILTGNYCQASAVHFFRGKFGLPEPVSTHGWFYFQALRTHDFKHAYVTIGISQDMLKELFSKVEQRGMFSNPYCQPDQNNQPVFFCSGPKCDLKRRWLIDRHMDPQFRRYMDEAGVIKAIAYFHVLKKHDPRILLFTEQQINTLGYAYLNQGRINEAISLFNLNVEEHPESSNVYDSMGEAYFVQRNFDQAARFYRKSLKLNPANQNARKYLLNIENLMSLHH